MKSIKVRRPMGFSTELIIIQSSITRFFIWGTEGLKMTWLVEYHYHLAWSLQRTFWLKIPLRMQEMIFPAVSYTKNSYFQGLFVKFLTTHFAQFFLHSNFTEGTGGHGRILSPATPSFSGFATYNTVYT